MVKKYKQNETFFKSESIKFYEQQITLDLIKLKQVLLDSKMDLIGTWLAQSVEHETLKSGPNKQKKKKT